MSPVTPNSPIGGFSLSLGGAPGKGGPVRPQPKLSLSQRRGMTLNGGAGKSASSPISGGESPVSIPAKGSSAGGQMRLNAKSTSLFSSYSQYIDVSTGSLKFAGKASLDAHGVNFANGTSFQISLDELELLEELGRGNYGTVTKVLHKPTNIVMAMKEIRLELDDAKFRQIIMELDVLHKCASSYIVDFYGAFFVEGAVYICMEYMDGGSLDKLYGGGVDEPILAKMTESVVRGLKVLKDDHNIIHRDVKPTNILASTKGTVKLCDFGVSGNLVASIARTNIGCQSYMAPERIKSANPADAITYTVQSDIWSLGLTLLEIANGSYPYPPETYGNVFSQLSAIVDGEPPTLPEPRFSHEAVGFIKQCLNKDALLRPTYAKLLAHPWLVKYRSLDVDLSAWVKGALERRNQGVPEVKKPALHAGGGIVPR
ncbi:kinase-like domain-containing protein [Lipomyces tetrasporus]|uniref:mitogen-activated protein kinase kinase n=1 Tax=Lipomyces tetrasporus TaxID=54092 RepID=A0AAD7VVE9_9ASCO|nr:kinase-like domain-containing protein [Lipomyces tetrasporus]KAJ8102911.1 kinase-like domain-containing protein [Lipomyces tetrasporus]